METAKVDIRKLQLLNDRINQTIDALNQVRLTVHGLSHTAGINPNVPNVGATAFGLGAGQQQAGFPQVPQGVYPQAQQTGFPQPGFPQPGFPQAFGGGLSHTPPFYGGVQGVQGGMNPYAALGLQGGVNPYAGIGSGVAGGWNPYLAQMGQIGQFGGLSHTGQEPIESFARPAWNDPLLAVKVAQTFPYAQFVVLPPVVALS
jgi:hypothetical protein